MKRFIFVTSIFCSQFAFASFRYECRGVRLPLIVSPESGEIFFFQTKGEIQPDGSYEFNTGLSASTAFIPQKAFEGAPVIRIRGRSDNVVGAHSSGYNTCFRR